MPIAFFSKTLDPTERNYAANEREALACLRACEHWEKFLLGRPFTLRTDHQALTTLLNNPESKRQSSKFQRWKERLAEFDYKLEYIPGPQNQIADYLSRIHDKSGRPESEEPVEDIKGIRMEDLQGETQKDVLLNEVAEYLLKEWPHGKNLSREIAPYKKVRKSLQYKDSTLFKDQKIVAPASMRKAILAEAHSGHSGMVRMKRLLFSSST